MVHDAQLDYYGKRLATASSDTTIKVFDVVGDSTTQPALLNGHSAPVWAVAWAHPMFGSMLASCSYDKKVLIWKEEAVGSWVVVHEHAVHTGSVNAIAWAPHEFGLMLAAGSSDGTISILTKSEATPWTSSVFKAHAVGVNSVSWAPALPEGSLTNTGRTARSDGSDLVHRFVSGGCDNMVKIWSLSNGEWTVEHALEHHTEWIRSVAWAPNVGLPTATIASAGQDGDIVVWSKDGSDSAWNKKVIATLPETPWSVSFSLTGNILAVAGADGNVSLWKEDLDAQWRQISSIAEQ